MDIEKIRSAIDADKDELISSIREIVAVPSVEGKPEPEAPFGAGPKAALNKFVEIGKRLGFRTWAWENQVGIAEFGDEDLPEMIGILAHVDVVPVGEGWDCDPWEGQIKDGLLYGRGVADDKGPAISAMYAMKALRDEGVKLNRRVRLIVGTNEETGSAAIANYVEAGQELPVAGFTPDGEFPLINGEKGIYTAKCSAAFAAGDGDISVKSINAGVAANAVPDEAVAVLHVADKAAKRLEWVKDNFAAPRDISMKIEKTGDNEYTISVTGLAFHGSRPQFGANAAAVLVKQLRLLGISGEQGTFLDKIDNLVGDQAYGENLGIMLYDDASGFSSLCWGILKTEGDRINFTLNYRFPVTFELETARAKFLKVLEDAGWKVSNPEDGSHPLYMGEDTELVKKLMKVYREETGDMEAKPMCIGGGTYAKKMPNMLAFGNQFPDENNHIHEIDERWSIEHIVLHTKIMASVIAELAGVKE